jgi:hypothetical protein
MPQIRQPLNDGWTVREPQGPFAGLQGGGPEPTAVRLPHDAMRDMERSPDAPSGAGSGYWPSAAWAYLRTLPLPAEWEGGRVALEIDGAYRDALVYANGALVTSCPGGYVRFWAEIGPYLHYGADNQIRIEVRTHRDSRWYSGAGLYRGVRLVVSGPVHIAPDGIVVTTPVVDLDPAVVEVATTLVNETNHLRTVRVRVRLADADGTVVATSEAPATLAPGEPSVARQRLAVTHPRAWSIEDPHLYLATVEVFSAEERMDADTVRVGLRTITVDPARGFRLNGGSLKLRGACIHHDNGPLGAVSMPRAEERRVAALKAAGFNAIRTAHNPASQALLDACDRVGMLVMNELADAWSYEKTEYDPARAFLDRWRSDVDAWVAGSRNHPSVVLYSLGNEIPEIGKPTGALWGRRIAERVRGLDPTRPITNGMNLWLAVDMSELIAKAGGLNALMGGGAEASDATRDPDEASAMVSGMNRMAASDAVSAAIEESSAVLDVAGYNYADVRYAADLERYPDRVLVGSETFPTEIGRAWPLIETLPNVIGDFTWTGWDYLGEAGIGGFGYAEDPDAIAAFGREWPYRFAYCGDIDVTGFRRPQSYYREIVFGLRHDPYLAVQRPERYGQSKLAPNAWAWSDSVASWTWPGFEGKPSVVEVYADADRVELLLDGRPVGQAVAGSKPYAFELTVPYEPGELAAVAYRDGHEIGRTALVTATGEVRLAVSADRETVGADDDLVCVEIALVDAEGRPYGGVDREVAVEVSGPATLAGVTSANPKSAERFDADRVRTFDGRALAVLRTTGAGDVTVRVAAGDLAAEVRVVAAV